MRYRITRYSPLFRDANGNYIKDTWTSYSDIGRLYDGKLFTLNEYLETEANYIRAILSILELQGIEWVEIQELEARSSPDESIQLLESNGLDLDSNSIRLLKEIHNGAKVNINDFQNLVALILRECLWCKLHLIPSCCTVEFGYDFYIYVNNTLIPSQLIDKFKVIGIYIENI